MNKCEAKKNIVRIKTIGNFEKERLELRNKFFKSFVLSWVVMIWLLRLAGLPRPGSNSKPNQYKKSTKKGFPKSGLILNETFILQTKKKEKNVYCRR